MYFIENIGLFVLILFDAYEKKLHLYQAWLTLYYLKKTTPKTLRKELGFTQVEFAESMNTTQATISKIEAGVLNGGKYREYLKTLVEKGADINRLFK